MRSGTRISVTSPVASLRCRAPPACSPSSPRSRRGDIVVVTINHRLNAFGYTYLGDIAGGEFALSGSAGMLDIVAALEWVRDNIGRFGGDPKIVTIFCEFA